MSGEPVGTVCVCMHVGVCVSVLGGVWGGSGCGR